MVVFVHYEQLDVYKLAYRLARDVHHASIPLPKFEQFGGLADQMRRASRGICANIAEGLSKMSSLADEKRFLAIALGSCEEMRVWSKFGEEFGYWTSEQSEQWRMDYARVAQMLIALMKKREMAA